MICPNCNSECADGAKFCTKCGASLAQATPAPAAAPIAAQPAAEQPFVAQPAPQPIAQPAPQPVAQEFGSATPASAGSDDAPLNYFAFILAAMMKPFKAVKEEAKKLANIKNAALFSLIVAVSLTVLAVLVSMISIIVLKDRSGDITFTFDYVGELDYFEIIWKNFATNAGFILGMAAVFFVAARVVKKEAELPKLLSISAVSYIPFVVCSGLLALLFSYLWTDFSIIFTVIGLIYSLAIFCVLVNEELKLEGDAKIYVNAACFSIVTIALYYIAMEVLKSQVTTSLLNYL